MTTTEQAFDTSEAITGMGVAPGSYGRVLNVHFKRPVTPADYAAITDALHALAHSGTGVPGGDAL